MASGGSSSSPGMRTTPRSISFRDRALSRITLSGLMSRWMMPARWSAAAARAFRLCRHVSRALASRSATGQPHRAEG